MATRSRSKKLVSKDAKLINEADAKLDTVEVPEVKEEASEVDALPKRKRVSTGGAGGVGGAHGEEERDDDCDEGQCDNDVKAGSEPGVHTRRQGIMSMENMIKHQQSELKGKKEPVVPLIDYATLAPSPEACAAARKEAQTVQNNEASRDTPEANDLLGVVVPLVAEEKVVAAEQAAAKARAALAAMENSAHVLDKRIEDGESARLGEPDL